MTVYWPWTTSYYLFEISAHDMFGMIITKNYAQEMVHLVEMTWTGEYVNNKQLRLFTELLWSQVNCASVVHCECYIMSLEFYLLS